MWLQITHCGRQKLHLHLHMCIHTYTHTQCGPKVLGLIFLKIEDTWGRHTFIFIQNELHWHIYRLLCGRIFSENLPTVPLFGPSLIHQLRFLGSQQHPQIWVLLTSFSTWGKEYSLAEIILESMGVIKDCNIFWGQTWQKLAALWTGELSCNKKKSREQNTAGRTR